MRGSNVLPYCCNFHCIHFRHKIIRLIHHEQKDTSLHIEVSHVGLVHGESRQTSLTSRNKADDKVAVQKKNHKKYVYYLSLNYIPMRFNMYKYIARLWTSNALEKGFQTKCLDIVFFLPKLLMLKNMLATRIPSLNRLNNLAAHNNKE